MVNDFQWLDIAGIDTDRAFRIPLSEMYVRLRVIFDEDSSVEEVEALQDIGPIDIKTALEKFPRLVIVGDPGSGKSTFLKYIALMIARAELENIKELATEALSIKPPFPIPVFISLWDLAEFLNQQDKEKATLHLIIDYIVHHFKTMEHNTNAKEIEQLLENGSYCMLFDGLDEVPTEQGRALISRLVEDFVDKYSQNRYVITSRIRAYSGDTIIRGEFVRCDIQEFSHEDREEFLRNWFALLFRIPREEVILPGSENQKVYKNLLTALERSDRIGKLAVNPLLLTVVAIVHWNRKRLPEQRVERISVEFERANKPHSSRLLFSRDSISMLVEQACCTRQTEKGLFAL